MELLCAIGTAIVGKIAEYTVAPVVRHISYVTDCKVNLQHLDAAVEELKAAKDSVANEVDVADRRGEIIQPDVRLWLKKVDEITAKTDQFFYDERPADLKCFHGGFCGNLKIRHRISTKSTKLLPEVVEVLYEKRGFSAVRSRTSIVKGIMDELKNPNSKRIGVYGIGGVGKTTLVIQVYRQATEKNLFDDVVILLEVKENPDLEGIQKKIVEKLGMKISESENETIDGRASRLCSRIKDRKTLVILDDVWEDIKLEAVGIPSVATCKILLTSRSRKTLSDMSTDKDFALDILEDEETWVLFENKAGDVVKDPAIRKVATQIAKYCIGLPVLVVTIASTLKKRTSLPLWEDALRRLEESNSQGLTEKAYLSLEWSYSQLNREELQPFFLLCGIAIRGNKIILTDLLRYGMGLGFLGKLSTLEEARNKVVSLVEELKDVCLLIEGDNSEYVRMPDLVRDVANRIALRDHYMFSLVVDGGGRELKEWWDKDFLEKCTIISLRCDNDISRLPKVLQCQALKMLLLQGDPADYSMTMPTFFQETKRLNVLALEKMCIPSLPSSFQSLKNVHTLCLERCALGDLTLVGELSNLEILSFAYSKFEQLSKEIAQLTHLRLLDLSYCSELQVISPGVISSLTRLEDLRMNKFQKWEAECEGSNASLLELKHLSRLTSLQINIPDANILPANLFSCFELERYQIVIGCASWLIHADGYDGTLNTLHIAGSTRLDKGLEMLMKKSHQLCLAGTCGAKNTLDHQLDIEDFQQLNGLLLLENFDFTYIINRKVVFPSLMTLRVDECHSLRFLFSSSMARSLVELKDLVVKSCENMEEIVLSTRGEDDEENMDNLFPKLQFLRLKSLPKLVRFCTSSYIEFWSLEELKLIDCYELESFICNPLNSGEKDREEKGLQYSLFNEKVGFPKLERLTINYLPKLIKIWGSQLSQNSFCKLRDVTVQQCNSLINILPDSIIASVFRKLQKLTVENCGVLEEIVAQEEGETLMPDQFVLFPELTCLELKSLPQLKRFYPRMHSLNWPLLKTLELFHCRIVDIFASGFSGLPKTPDFGGLRNPVKQPFVLIEKSSFPNLEDLTLGPMDIGYDPPAPVAFYKQAVFPGISSRHTDLKKLRLHGIEKLMRLWEENTKPLGPVFLQLKTLEVKFCGLTNQKLSAISFKNLTSLEVSFCWRLQYLTTYSVAQSLGQLEKLKVDECKSMKEILANDGVGEDASNCEIDFKQLRHLELSDLISLERFCTRNCTVKIPLLETSALVVNWCSLKLKISSNRTLEEVDSKMHLNVQKSHSRKEAGATTEATGSLETNQKQPTPNASEGAQDIESEHGAVNKETTINSQNMEPAADKVTNTSKNLQEADSGRRHRISRSI